MATTHVFKSLNQDICQLFDEAAHPSKVACVIFDYAKSVHKALICDGPGSSSDCCDQEPFPPSLIPETPAATDCPGSAIQSGDCWECSQNSRLTAFGSRPQAVPIPVPFWHRPLRRGFPPRHRTGARGAIHSVDHKRGDPAIWLSSPSEPTSRFDSRNTCV